MALNQNIEDFALQLFNRLWLDYGLMDKPLTPKDAITPIETILIEDIVQAVKVRQALFRSSLKDLFDLTYSDFRTSASDFYSYLEDNFDRLGFANDSAMEKVLTACVFVAEMCQYACSRNNHSFVPLSYLICAMYIDQRFGSEFCVKVAWWSLIRTCQTYTLPFVFMKYYSETVTSPYGENFISFCASDCKMSLDSMKRFSKVSFQKYPPFTMLWVDYCIKDLEKTSSQPKFLMTSLNIGEVEGVLKELKCYCDPFGSSTNFFDELARFALRNGRQPPEIWSAFVTLRPFDRASGPTLPAAEILALERRVSELVFSPISEKQSCDNQNYEELLALFFELHNKNRSGIERTVGVEPTEKGLKRSLHLLPFPSNTSQISTTSFYDETTQVTSSNTSFYDETIQVTSSNTSFYDETTQVTSSNTSFYDETIQVTSSNSSKSASAGNEYFSSSIQNSGKAFSSYKESSGPQKACEHNQNDGLVTNSPSQLDVNSPKNVRISSSYSQSSSVMTKRRSGDKETSRVSEKTHSPKISNEFSSTTISRKNKKAENQETRLLSQLSLDGVNISPSYSPSLDVMKRRKYGGKKNSVGFQASEKTLSPKVFNESSSTSISQKDDKDKSKVNGLLSQLDMNSISPDGINISQNYSRSSGVMNARRSSGKENSSSIKVSEKTCQTYKFKDSACTPQSQKNKEVKDQRTDLLSRLDINSLSSNDLKTSRHSQDSVSIKRRKSKRKENPTSNVQNSKNSIFAGKNISDSQSAVKTLEGKKDKGVITNTDVDSFLTDSAYVSPNHSPSSKDKSLVEETPSSYQKIEDILLEYKLIESLNTKIQWLFKSLDAKHQGEIANGSINCNVEEKKLTNEAMNGVQSTDCIYPLEDESAVKRTPSSYQKTEDILLEYKLVKSLNTQIQRLLKSLGTKHQGEIANGSINFNVEEEKLTNEAMKGVQSIDCIYPSESPSNPLRENAISNTFYGVLEMLKECRSKVTDETSHLCDVTTTTEDSSQLPAAANTDSMQKTSDRMITEDCLNKTRSKVHAQSSCRTSDMVSGGENDKTESVEDGLKTANASPSSRNSSRSRIPNTSNGFVGNKKSKAFQESILTRRQRLLKTDKNAKDVLRMIHVLGNKTSLENIKSTLKRQ